jgi:predicted TIM-barrel fold metal-dependent hydrolase
MTSPSQFDSINSFAATINELFADKKKRLVSFAGIHPLCEDIEGKIKFIKDKGFLGIKLHPDYQGTYIDDEKYNQAGLYPIGHTGSAYGLRSIMIWSPQDRWGIVAMTNGYTEPEGQDFLKTLTNQIYKASIGVQP